MLLCSLSLSLSLSDACMTCNVATHTKITIVVLILHNVMYYIIESELARPCSLEYCQGTTALCA